ncbi:MAG: response regulator [Candidatus Thiodiazotropha sp. 6PLUC2]
MSKQQDSDGMAEQALNRFIQHTGDKPVVLIADDSRVVRVSLRNILKEECHLIEVEDGVQAWQQLTDNPSINLVFSDLSMPNLDGRGLLSKIRNSDANHIANLPFIVVTGNEASPEIADELEKLGATGMVNKPFDPNLIKQFVTELATESSEEISTESQATDPQTDFLEETADKSQFMEVASRELSFAIRNKNELALALVQIDQFSSIIEHYSEAAIEHILLAVKDIIQLHIHPDDTLAYFGSGCFSILRPASNAIGTRYLGRRILDDLAAKQFYLGESDQSVGASIGISAPDIKPGIRLQDLLILAEGRLKAALENGGEKVVDKGNENLTPVSSQENSELSNVISNTQTSSPHSLTKNTTEINRLAAEQVAEIKAKYSSQSKDVESQASQIADYKQTLELLTAENRALIEDVNHWKKESSEAEQLRRQLFEVESQFQQLKVKFTEVHTVNSELAQRSETIDRENRRLIDEEEERTASLRQSHQILEGENNRLEEQMRELKNRAERAELESLKSNQLVSSLRDNGNLLRMQLDQLQQQVNELQEQHYEDKEAKVEAKEPVSTLVEKSSELKSDTELLDELYKPEIALSATPEIKPSAEKTTTSVHLFPDKDQISAKQKSSNKVKIPPFRVEAEPLLFKNGFNLSSFTIASIILTALLLVGGIYLYLVMSDEPTHEVAAVQQVDSENNSKSARASSSSPLPATSNPDNEQAQKGHLKSPPQIPTQSQHSNSRSADRSLPTISDELRLEKELTLRQMAEEEFSRSIDRPSITESTTPQQTSAPYFEQSVESEFQGDLVTEQLFEQPQDLVTEKFIEQPELETSIPSIEPGNLPENIE